MSVMLPIAMTLNIHTFSRIRRSSNHIRIFLLLTLLASSALIASAQDDLDPLSDLELQLDPTEAPKKNSDARFTDDLIQDAKKYATGKGYRYDPVRAFELYKKAAETDHPFAVYQLARCLILGEGVKKDMVKGDKMLRDLAKTLVHSKGFKHRKGTNPVTLQNFKLVSDLRPSAIDISDFTAKDGTNVVSPKVLNITEKDLRVMHSTGISTFNWEDLPGFVQSAIGYDAVSTLFETAILAELKH